MPAMNDCGVIVYDIPDELKAFGNYLRRILRRGRALPVNKSVYLVNWADKPHIDSLVVQAKEKHAELLQGRVLAVRVLKFHDVSGEEAYDLAREGLHTLIAGVGKSLNLQLKNIQEAGELELSRSIQVRLIKKLQEAECLAVAFRLMDDVGVALEAVRTAMAARLSAEVVEKHLKAKEEPVTA